MLFVDQDLQSIQEARILVESARDAHTLLQEYDQKDLNRIVEGFFTQLLPEIPELIDSELVVRHTGCREDKVQFAKSFFGQLKEPLLAEQVVGILANQDQSGPKTIGVSLGVVAVILPRENIIVNGLYAALIALKAGNAVILVPQSHTEAAVAHLFTKLASLSESTGLPAGALSYLQTSTEAGIKALSCHPAVALVLALGCPELFTLLESSNKPLIYGGTGGTPVFIERSADLKEAAKAIVTSRGFDNGLLPAAEQFVIAEDVIAGQLKEELSQAGAYFMNEQEEQQLIQFLFVGKNQVNPLCIGQAASELAKRAGFTVSDTTQVLVSEQPYIFDENPFATELKCPILTFYLEPDWIHACEKCLELLREKETGHTLAIHSHNQAVIQEFALKKPVGRMIVNGPASFTSVGLNSTLPLSLILGGLTTGRGYTAKNITAFDLTYQRAIGYTKVKEQTAIPVTTAFTEWELLEKIVRKIID